MDFYGLKCPACNTPLEKDDDIVVCPVCGAPHHRECYEEDGHCYFEEKHKDNFDYDEYIKEKQSNKADSNENSGADNGTDKAQSAPDSVICGACGTKNPGTNFYCSRCGSALNSSNIPGRGQEGQPGYGAGNMGGMPFGPGVAFDPMAGVNPDDVLDDEVTAGEAAKYVQKNTPYFIRVFKNISDCNKSRFNFCAFLFTGGYMLYRKIYKLGILFTVIAGLLTLGTLLVETLPVFGWIDIYKGLVADINDVTQFEYYQILVENAGKLPAMQKIIFYTPYICSLLRWVFMFIAGGITNRAYFKTVIKKTKKIKDETTDNPSERKKRLDFSGGVNTTIAIVLVVCYVAISFLPYLFL